MLTGSPEALGSDPPQLQSFWYENSYFTEINVLCKIVLSIIYEEISGNLEFISTLQE